jgi:two-component system, NarL family, response regulator DegU
METEKQRAPGRAPRVLLVDHDHQHTVAVRATLEAEGMEVLAAANEGRQAVALADQLRPDVVIIDMSLPSLDGFEAAILIRERHSWIQVIFLTAHSELFGGDGFGDSGAFACLARDCPPEEMRDVISQAWWFGQEVRRADINVRGGLNAGPVGEPSRPTTD